MAYIAGLYTCARANAGQVRVGAYHVANAIKVRHLCHSRIGCQWPAFKMLPEHDPAVYHGQRTRPAAKSRRQVSELVASTGRANGFKLTSAPVSLRPLCLRVDSAKIIRHEVRSQQVAGETSSCRQDRARPICSCRERRIRRVLMLYVLAPSEGIARLVWSSDQSPRWTVCQQLTLPYACCGTNMQVPSLFRV